MEKIDRLGWAAGMCFETYGLRIGLRVDQPDALERAVCCLPWGWKAAPSPIVEVIYSLIAGGVDSRVNVRRFNLLYRGPFRVQRTLEPDQVFTSFETDLQLLVAEHARRRVFVHAGVVGWQGQAIVLPGRSLSGKSTLVAALIRAGATYYSDEYAVIDSRGYVYPFARPLALRQTGDFPSRRISAEELGGEAGVRPLPIGLVVCTRYKEGADWRPRTRTAGQGLLALLANTVPARRKPRLVLATLRKAVAQARVVQGLRGEAEQTVERLLGTATSMSRTNSSTNACQNKQ